MLDKLPSFISTTAMTSSQSCLLLPRDHFHAVIFSVPCSELSMTSFPKSASFSSVDSQISFPTTLSHTHSALDTLALLFLKISMDLSTSGPLCFLFPLPYHLMVSLGLVSHFLESCLLRETFHSILIYNFKFAIVV